MREYQRRFEKHFDELKWLYMELYDDETMFGELCDEMYRFYTERMEDLKELDQKRIEDSQWYRKNDMLGMMFYIDNFSANLKGLKEKIAYIESCNVNYIHLMPFLKTPKGKSDGGYAVADFRQVQPELGTMDELREVAKECRKKQISVCMDFVMNHTSEEHEWAVRARRGEEEYRKRYFFYENYDIPAQYEKTVPQVFPTTAPGNFTYLPETGHYVLTSFYPYQWDLNYRNPRVFNEMMYNFLYLANAGIDVVRIDAVPYIWKELGTDCRNLKQVHTIVRMMRMISEIVCPAVVLLGEVVMEPAKVAPYFGTVEKPECHMLYNVTTMATTWHTVATGDTRLLKMQMDIINNLPKEYTFLNYLRCHDDIGWGLDYPTLRTWAMEERPHKEYINEYFLGNVEGSYSRGELYNYDPVTGDARFCGTTASMCGLEAAMEEQNEDKTEEAIERILMLHAYMFTQSGIPVLYSGDEIGQLNDNEYHRVADKAADSRYIHRGKFQWNLAEKIQEKGTVQEKIFHGLEELIRFRAGEHVFAADADCYTVETGEKAVLCIVREYKNEKLTAIFNFSNEEKTVFLEEINKFTVKGNNFLWIKEGPKDE